MPVFNELSTLEEAIGDALSAELSVLQRELIVVDDGSTDGSREWLGSSRHCPRTSESSCTRETRARAQQFGPHSTTHRGRSPRSSMPTWSTAAADLGPVLEPLLAGEARVVFGTRAWASQSSFSFWYVIGNKSVTIATNVLYNCWISDVMTCHKAMSTELFRSLRLRERGFAIEPEIAARVLRSGERIFEVPIALRGALPRRGEEADGRRRPSRAANARALQIRLDGFSIGRDRRGRGRGPRVRIPRLLSRSRAEPLAKRRIGEQPFERFAESRDVARRHHETRDAVFDRVREAPDAGRDDGRP